MSTFQGYSSDFLPLNVSRAALLDFKKLSMNKGLFIVHSGKVNDMVILHKVDYINKVKLLLWDTCDLQEA